MQALGFRWVTLAIAGFSFSCGSDAPSTPSGRGLSFCDVEPILADKCQRCHGSTPKNGAPFSLVSYADTQVATPTAANPERKRHQDMLFAVEQGEMPYRALTLDPPVQGLTCEERTTLITWLRSGAEGPPARVGSCDEIMPMHLACDQDL